MEHNVGSTDRIVRLVAGAVLAVVGIAAAAGTLGVGPVVGVISVLIGGILIGTALARSCPLYRIVGMNTSDRA